MILNKQNGKLYLGRTAEPGNRKRGHFSELRRRVHGNPKLQAAFNKYGESSFIFEVLDSVENGRSENAEAIWFAKYNYDKKLLYNCHFETYGGPKFFGPMANATKQKISEAIKENTRPKAYAALQDMHDNGISFVTATKKYNVSSSTLCRYKSEWETESNKAIEHPQVKNCKARISEFVQHYKNDPADALSNFSKYKLTRKSLDKYLPGLGIDPKEIRFDHWRTKAAARADAAVQMVLNTGCSAAQAIKACGAKNSAYYRRLKEVKLERGLLRDLSTTV